MSDRERAAVEVLENIAYAKEFPGDEKAALEGCRNEARKAVAAYNAALQEQGEERWAGEHDAFSLATSEAAEKFDERDSEMSWLWLCAKLFFVGNRPLPAPEHIPAEGEREDDIKAERDELAKRLVAERDAHLEQEHQLRRELSEERER